MSELYWEGSNRVAIRPPIRFFAPRAGKRLRGLAVAVAAAVGLSLGASQFASAAQPVAPAAGEAATLLGHIQWAAEHRNYTGRFVHQEGSLIQTSRITHSADASGEVEKLEMLDGRIREYVRHGDDIQGYIPDRKLIVIEKRLRREAFPALLAGPAMDVDDHYRLERGAPERVAGHLCDVARLVPRDELRYGYRLWVDRASGLLMKIQTLDEKGAVLEQVAFTDIHIGGHIERSELRPSFPSTDGWHTEQHTTEPASFDTAPWSLSSTPPGFRPILEVKRTFGSGKDVGQIVLSDGLAAISLFVESASEPARTEGEVTKGATNIITKALGGYWLTVVGEAPLQTVRDIASLVAVRGTPQK